MNKRIQQNKRKQKHKSTRNICAYAMMACALVLAGCSRSEFGVQRSAFIYTQSSGLRRKACLTVLTENVARSPRDSLRSTQHVIEIAEDVLTGMHFTIEKADVQNGFIRTRPLPGAQFFEFWRSDNVGSDNTLAANLHTIRRTVTLDVSRQNMELHLGCDVHVQRLSLPERQVDSSARVYGMFSTSSPSLQRLQLNPEQKKDMEWIDMGRDPQLEAEILKRIKTQIVQRTNHRLQTTENET